MSKIRDYEKFTALYERLSKDDEQQGESNSISNQKKYLEDFARKSGFVNLKHYTDDGYTGRNFNRPGFQEMLADLEAGKVGAIIVKDMSRFGRNYLQVGFYTEVMFPKKGVRFIAVNNNVDSDSPMGNDFTPFLNIMNEWYAKDTSNKIRSIFLSRMNDGKRCSGSIPYGYNRLPGDKQTLVVDPVASQVVRRIFELAAQSKGPTEIARILTKDQVLVPSAYTMQYHPEQCNRKAQPGYCTWNTNTVAEILRRQEYLGHTVLRKTIATNFKTDGRRNATEEERLVFQNTHQAIVSQELWDRAQARLIKRPKRVRYKDMEHDVPLSGLVYCADCGKRMSFEHHYYTNGQRYYSFRCSTYAAKRNTCTGHHILEKDLNQLVLHALQRIIQRMDLDEEALCQELKHKWREAEQAKPKQWKQELAEARRRFEELDEMTCGLYENYAAGKLPERQYMSLMRKYDDEQSALETRIAELEEQVNRTETEPIQAERFLKMVRKYTQMETLDGETARELIDKIVVHQAQGRRPNRTQEIDIYFNFIGKFDMAYSQEELEEIRSAQEREKAEKMEHRAEQARQRIRALRQREKEERWAKNEGHKYPKAVCPWCGKEFWPNSNRQRFCCKACTTAQRKAGGEAVKQEAS